MCCRLHSINKEVAKRIAVVQASTAAGIVAIALKKHLQRYGNIHNIVSTLHQQHFSLVTINIFVMAGKGNEYSQNFSALLQFCKRVNFKIRKNKDKRAEMARYDE